MKNEYRYSLKKWARSDCTIDADKSDADPKCDKGKYKYQVKVGSRKTPLPAFENQEKRQCGAKKKEEGDKLACWWDENADYVILEEGGYSSTEKRHRKMRAVLTTLTTVVFGLVMLHFFRRALITLIRPQQPPSRRRPSPREVRIVPMAAGGDSVDGTGYRSRGRRQALSARDAQTVVHALRDDESLNTDDVCAICLEDFSTTSQQRRTRLPCNHLFHEDCTLLMLQKGHPSCPCCLYDLYEDTERLRQSQCSSRTSVACDSQHCPSDASTRASSDRHQPPHDSSNVQRRNDRHSNESSAI